jgi:hypothetical protein
MSSDGAGVHEMAVRLRKRPRTVKQILEFGSSAGGRTSTDRLRPIERLVMDGIEAGDNYGIIASRIGHSGPHTRRIAAYARFKLDGGPLIID